ncbi:hypothetical protein [Bacteroides caccae]|jgi:hypothetical protein|uniref:Uncharacterized protein n=1 Tax=Bacteroides caccae TaxID=47678 RepID=A0A414FNJ5_9BACE|nr:hypothetical protein [Bacteroides caccae]RHD51081.1 hypothetical protein DW794_05705 [Bacteroides caccae]
MTTYKQPEKDKSRVLLWNHAVESLTSLRDSNRILNTTYMEHLWLYCQQQLNEKLDIEAFIQWKQYADICYQTKKPEELKIAFFCGNEPENDVKHLLGLGVRIENIYAFECDSNLFNLAVKSLHNTYPLLKIYKGKIEVFAELQNTKFDIVYLDFTGSLFKEYKVVLKMLDLNALNDMSILAINTTYLDKTEENIEILTNFFYNDTFFESSVLTSNDTEEENSKVQRAEGCDALGIDIENLRSIIDMNFENAYSAFQTALIIDYANRHKPAYEVFKQDMLSKRLINSKVIAKKEDFFRNFHDVLIQESFMDGQRLPSNQYLEDEFIEKLSNGTKRSRLECIKIAEVFLQSPYSHSLPVWNKIEEHIKHGASSDNDIDDEYIDVDFKQVVTPEVNQVISEINNWFYGQCRFCDVPMAHLWLELLLFHYGHPYHTNIGNHKRYSYTAKKRKMCLDIFTLDKCRTLYDWIPMLEYFIYDMQDNNRQMITRMCIDAIGKQLLHIVDEIFEGSALVGINEFEWSINKELPNREEISVKKNQENIFLRMIKTLRDKFRKIRIF